MQVVVHSFLGPLGDFESLLPVAAVLSVEPGQIVRCWSEAWIQRQELLDRLLTICDISLALEDYAHKLLRLEILRIQPPGLG